MKINWKGVLGTSGIFSFAILWGWIIIYWPDIGIGVPIILFFLFVILWLIHLVYISITDPKDEEDTAYPHGEWI